MLNLVSLMLGMAAVALATVRAGLTPPLVQLVLARLGWTDWAWADWVMVPLALVGLALAQMGNRSAGTWVNFAALVLGGGMMVLDRAIG